MDNLPLELGVLPGPVGQRDVCRAVVECRCRCGHVALSERELVVIELVAAGYTDAQIGRRLHLSKQSVSRAVGELLAKTDSRNRAEIVARAYAGSLLETLAWPPRRRDRTCLTPGDRQSVRQ